MAEVRRTIEAPPTAVWATLTDPTTYPRWLVGAQEIRAVEDGWPAPGSRFHHRVGIGGPITVSDSTEVKELDPPHRLVLEARARPFGRALVTFTLEPDGASTAVVFHERPLGRLRHLGPLLDRPTAARNQLSLKQLAECLETPGDVPA